MINRDDIEFRSVEEIQQFQNEQLRKAVAYLSENSPFYQRMFKDNGIVVGDIMTTDDLQKVPFTTKSDLKNYNKDFICVPKSKILDYVTTSGTLGEPVAFPCTESDYQRLSNSERKSFECAGVKPGDVVQIMTTLDKRFIAGIAYFLGLRRLGACMIRVGNGIPELQWDTIRQMQPDTIMCVPSFILRLIQYAEENGIDYKNSSVKRIIGIGEGLREQDFSLNLLGKRIKEKWDVELFATYASTEMSSSIAECQYGCGHHLHPEFVIFEIVDDNGKVVADGEYGEVVITTLGVEGMPLLRFKTGDIAAKRVEPCQCGRNSYRLTPLVGRKNNMIKLKGTSLYPPAIYDVLDHIPHVENYIVIVEDSKNGTDEVTVKVGLKGTYNNNDDDIIKEMKDHFRARIRVTPNIEICPVADIAAQIMPAKSRKPLKFFDNRKRKSL